MGYSRPRLIALQGSYVVTAVLADSTSYYFGHHSSAMSGSAGTRPLYIPVSGHIRRVVVQIRAITEVGTNENWSFYLRVNDTTDYLIATVGAAAQKREWVNNSLNIPISSGDFIEFKTTTPAWATNPLGDTGNGCVVIETP